MKFFRTRRSIRILSLLFAITMILGIVVSVNIPASAAPVTVKQPQPRIVTYFEQWGIYGANYVMHNIVANGSTNKISNLNYAFANIITTTNPSSPYQCGSADPFADFEAAFGPSFPKPNNGFGPSVDGTDNSWWGTLRGNAHQIQELKVANPNLKALISIGGWTFSGYFSQMASTDLSRKAFVTSCINSYIKGDFSTLDPNYFSSPTAFKVFDGFDLDWEYPTACGDNYENDPSKFKGCPPGTSQSPADKQNFTLLLKEFRNQLDALGGQHYLLTAALSPGPGKYEQLELDKIGQYLDYADLMAYDFHGAWEPNTNFGAPLRPSQADPTINTRFTIAEAVQGYASAGFPLSKLVIGNPFYAHAWKNVPPTNNGLYQSGNANWALDSAGYASLINLPDYKAANVHCDPISLSWWMYVPDKNGPGLGEFTSFDPPASMTNKAHFIHRYRLGGAMSWELTGDNGDLINALYNGLTDGSSTMACSTLF